MDVYPGLTRTRCLPSEFNQLLVYNSTMLKLTDSKTTSCLVKDLFVKYACFSVAPRKRARGGATFIHFKSPFKDLNCLIRRKKLDYSHVNLRRGLDVSRDVHRFLERTNILRTTEIFCEKGCRLKKS